MEKFEIGEVAILQNTGKISLDGLEITVTGRFMRRRYAYPNRQGQMEGDCWSVAVPGGYTMNSAEADQLKKKRPPQDWNKLCKLDTLPDIDTRSTVQVNAPPRYQLRKYDVSLDL